MQMSKSEILILLTINFLNKRPCDTWPWKPLRIIRRSVLRSKMVASARNQRLTTHFLPYKSISYKRLDSDLKSQHLDSTLFVDAGPDENAPLSCAITQSEVLPTDALIASYPGSLRVNKTRYRQDAPHISEAFYHIPLSRCFARHMSG